MNELIAISSDSNYPVSGRELHAQLKVATHYKDWFPRMCEYGFEDGRDFCSKMSESTGGRPAVDHEMTISMAKEICMLQRSEIGRQVRRYLIEVEQAWNEPALVMARALKWADQQMAVYQAQILELKPKADFYDTVTGSRTAIPFDQASKVLGYRNMGRNKLFEFLRNEKVLMADNQPYQTYIDRGYFRVVESKYTKPNGDTAVSLKTLIHQKGLDYVRKLLDKAGYPKSNIALVQ